MGNALNNSTFRGGARGFQLDALLKVCHSQLCIACVSLLTPPQLKETRTVKATPDCPTLLHYLAKVLLRSEPSTITFIEDMPHVEAAARGGYMTTHSIDTGADKPC